MAARQLRELQRLMAWSWDSRVDEHPPGEKAMHDFENVLSCQLDNRRRPRTTPQAAQEAKDAAAAASSAAAAASSPALQAAGELRRGSAERGAKRVSPAPGAGDGNKAGGRRGAKAARVESSPEVQQEEASPLPGAQRPLAAAAETDAEAQLAAAAAVEAMVAAAAAAAASPAGVEATPAARQQQPLVLPGLSPAPPASCSAFTPAMLLGGMGYTPATAAMPTTGRTITTGCNPAAAALADAQCMPTPAPTPLALAGVPRPPSGVVMHAQASQPLQAAAAEAAMASEPQFRQPAPRGVLTGHKHVTVVAAEPGQGLPGVAASPAAATAFDFLCMAGTTAAGASAAPMDVDGAPAAAAPAPAAAPQPAAPLLQQQQQLAASAAATAAAAEAPMVAAAEVPTPVIQAFAAEGQPGYLHPRPLACPPLFKQPTPAGSRPPPVKSPLGKQAPPSAFADAASADKENGSANGAARLTPRTAEPAAPHPVVLSARKQQQLQQLSAGFHSRQRRLLELLSACNRVQQVTAPAAAAAPSAAGKAAWGAAKPPLGPRAAAVAAAGSWASVAAGEGRPRGGMGRALGRLKDQQAA